MRTIWTIDIEAPPERVWRELTTTGKAQRFYFDSMLEGDLRPGGRIRYATPDGKHTFIEGEVVEFTAPSRFVHTFRFTDLAEPAQQVAFDLQPIATGTRVTVRHDALDKAPKHGRRVDSGWERILRDLKAWTETGRIPLRTRVLNSLMGLMAPLLPRGT